MRRWVIFTILFVYSGFNVAQAQLGSALPAAAASTSAGVSQVPSASPNSGILSFQAWKQTQFDDAKAVFEKLQPVANFARPGDRPQRPRTDQRSRQAQLNIQIAQELNINDYFVLYLNQFRSKDMLVEVARKLTPEEIADLLQSYQKHLAGSEQTESPVASLLTNTGTLPLNAATSARKR